MAKHTPSMAKNQMKRCMNAILDPHPSSAEVKTLWQYFDSSCVYCGKKLLVEDRNGHLDHIIAQSEGGTNNIHNFLLACGRCNGDEKRELDWKEFLEQKATSDSERETQYNKVIAWMKQAPADLQVLDAETLRQASEITAQAMRDFDTAVEKLRALRK